jgi:hypothetical protein
MDIIGLTKPKPPPQHFGLASQLASAGLNQGIPGMATNNHLINQAVNVVSKQTGSMNVPFM